MVLKKHYNVLGAEGQNTGRRFFVPAVKATRPTKPPYSLTEISPIHCSVCRGIPCQNYPIHYEHLNSQVEACFPPPFLTASAPISPA